MKACPTSFHKFHFISLCAHWQRLAAEQVRPCHPCPSGSVQELISAVVPRVS